MTNKVDIKSKKQLLWKISIENDVVVLSRQDGWLLKFAYTLLFLMFTICFIFFSYLVLPYFFLDFNIKEDWLSLIVIVAMISFLLFFFIKLVPYIVSFFLRKILINKSINRTYFIYPLGIKTQLFEIPLKILLDISIMENGHYLLGWIDFSISERIIQILNIYGLKDEVVADKVGIEMTQELHELLNIPICRKRGKEIILLKDVITKMH